MYIPGFKVRFVGTLLLATALLAACGGNKKKQTHLPDDKMQALLTDIYLAEAYTSSLPVDTTVKPRPGKNLDSLAVFYKTILDKHGVTYTEFSQSMDWYRSNPGQLDSIYRHMQVDVERTKERLLNP
jgi:hypothetical protein